jgi:hypothetical protein
VCSLLRVEVPPNTLVVLALNPADYVLTLHDPQVATHHASGFSGEVATRADQSVVLRFSADAAPGSSPTSTVGEPPPWGDVTVTVTDGSLALSDALFLLSVLLLTEHHQDAFLHRTHPWMYVDAPTQRRFELPHPPRIETSQALLGSVPVPTRIRLLIEACELAVPVWTAWAKGADLTYFDGVMAMSSVPRKLAESTIEAVRTWLEDGDPAPLQSWSGEYRSLHWPMLEDNLTIPENVYYGLFAPCNLVDCALEGGNLTAALTCIQQATAARATNAQDHFLGEPFRKAFFLAWWRACLRVLCAA